MDGLLMQAAYISPLETLVGKNTFKNHFAPLKLTLPTESIKHGGWKTTFLWDALFSGTVLVLRRVIYTCFGACLNHVTVFRQGSIHVYHFMEVKLAVHVVMVICLGERKNPLPLQSWPLQLLGMPQKVLILLYFPTFLGILSGAGFFPSTELQHKFWDLKKDGGKTPHDIPRILRKGGPKQ